MRREKRPHCMRVMLVANLDVEHGHANGATGRLVHWSPEVNSTNERVKHVRANVPEVQARFYHEASYHSNKKYFLPQVDFIDIEPRKEVVATARGKPSMLQLTIQPAYCLTIHKVQALTIRHDVNGCLEGMFAFWPTIRSLEPRHRPKAVSWSRPSSGGLVGRSGKSMDRNWIGCK